MNPRIGVLKLVPKVHKLSEPIHKDTWLELKSRPIRGAENDPMNVPSKALYKFLQAMLSDFKQVFPSLNHSNQISDFTVLSGCEDYLHRLSLIKMEQESHCSTFIISADFADAYTETHIPKLQESISVIGQILKYDKQKIDLIKNIVSLVFNHCYFLTPTGLYRQTHGMPMGDFSSRDGLDCVLTLSEFEIISLLNCLPMKVHLYSRLVDDISILVQGTFEDVEKLLNIMADPTLSRELANNGI